jgi:hypothetical protein
MTGLDTGYVTDLLVLPATDERVASLGLLLSCKRQADLLLGLVQGVTLERVVARHAALSAVLDAAIKDAARRDIGAGSDTLISWRVGQEIHARIVSEAP